MNIDVERLAWGVPGKPIVRDVTVRIRSGQTVGLIGPNGSGKSSLLRCIAGLREPTAGVIRYDGHDIRGWSARRIARRVAFAEQSVDADSDLRVADVVALGRIPFRSPWKDLDRTDRRVIDAALERLELAGLRTREWKTLSGGERQRAHIARALAQQPWCILLDEPTNHLDIKHQLALMDLLAGTDQTVLVALHDLSLAARSCDRLILMSGGALIADGTPEEVLTPERLRNVFDVEARVAPDPLGNLAIAYARPGAPITAVAAPPD
ncbi:ABC transporter ATP-binding protein [Planomonospora sp. ID82291]|uniref:ABC transporter ATP-binding protein n=1 Tax=Planomonospora sp. ID82291 TaxID=2738136 RepID=UPI0018C35AB2|nr:ABC transporter ATP-binding protein [Planomonospora sp. ID82291]MBG0816788.1 ABC transporter ATP-binding protein [Planomonospora sp. ID82291]